MLPRSPWPGLLLMQFDRLNRREFITLLGGAAAAPPLLVTLAARARQLAMPVVGFLGAPWEAPYAKYAAVVREGLKDSGYVEGSNVAIEYRWAEGQYNRLGNMAAELVTRQVAVIVAIGGAPAALAAKAATSMIPIVFTLGADPIELGLVASLSRPGGNITGISLLNVTLEAKRLELLREMVPTASLIGMLINPSNPQSKTQMRQIQEAARAIGQQVLILGASTERELEAAVATFVDKRIGALIIGADTFFLSQAAQLGTLIERNGNLSCTGVGRERRFNELRSQPFGRISFVGGLCRQDSQWREAGRLAGPAADEIRVDHQSQNGEGASPDGSTDYANDPRRGDRVAWYLLHLLTTGFGGS
jgi:putative ABC transport system substrate-binding protein